MNLFVFLAIWAFLWYIPMPPRKFKLKSGWRFASLMLGLLIFFVIQSLQTPLSLFVYLLILTRLFVAIIEWSVSLRPIKVDEPPQYPSVGTRIPVKLSFKLHKMVILLLIGISCSLLVH